MEGLVEAAIDHARGARIVGVHLEIGRRSGVAVDAIRFCFEVCAAGTVLAGATLAIDETAGDELRVKHLEVIDVP